MQLPTVRGIIDRRILINFQVDPGLLAKLLPAPFRPKLVGGAGMAGVCLIRLERLRPRFLPGLLGIGSENAAHRMAVEWNEDGQLREGVFIPRRDTSSRFNALAGGRLFPGIHHHAEFRVAEQDGRYRIAIDSDDRQTHLAVAGHTTDDWPPTSIFRSRGAASDFFERGSLGYSTTLKPGEFDGLELRSFGWKVQPLAIEQVESSFFDDRTRFPAGSVQFDSALLMKNIPHEWHGRQPLRTGATTARPGGCG